MKKLLTVIALVILTFGRNYAQCAMCRATLETSVSNGDSIELASTLNFAILYLLALPYLLVFTIGFLWYRKARKSRGDLLAG